VAKALKHDFIPYLHVVMPPLLKAADIKVDVQVPIYLPILSIV
jgi:hypothetical protein